VLENTLFRFDDIDGKKLLPFFTKEFVFISKQSEQKYYSTFILSTLKKYNVNAKGFNVSKEDVNPIAQLSLENSISTEPIIVLRFKYGNKHIIQRNHSFNKLITISDGDEFAYNKIERKLGYENNYISILNQLGLHSADKISFIAKATNRETSFYDYINWININEKKLSKNGFEIVQKYNQNDYYLNSFDLKIDVNNVEDWFDIRAYVYLNGHRIPFLSFKKNISKGIREYVLPDGEIFILPEEWFSRYKDLFSFSDNENEGIKLKKQHFPVLQEVLEGVDKEKYKKLANIEIKETDEKIPDGVLAQLRPYQAEGYSWMVNLQKNNFGICLADDMGLGKTLQTLTLLKASIDSKRLVNNNSVPQNNNQQLSLFDAPQEITSQKAKPTIIITPTSLVHNWINEINKFTPDVSASSYVGTNRPPFQLQYNKYEVIVTSYGILRNDIEEITKNDFFYCILDESQAIKNHESKTYQAVLQVEAEHRIVLTGTPIENSLSDLWSQMNFLNRGLLGNFQFFKNEFLNPIESNSDDTQREKLKQLIQPFILRRTKKQVAQDLPELNR
jgi:SNF2 family DNA or RNA helicase